MSPSTYIEWSILLLPAVFVVLAYRRRARERTVTCEVDVDVVWEARPRRAPAAAPAPAPAAPARSRARGFTRSPARCRRFDGAHDPRPVEERPTQLFVRAVDP